MARHAGNHYWNYYMCIESFIWVTQLELLVISPSTGRYGTCCIHPDRCILTVQLLARNFCMINDIIAYIYSRAALSSKQSNNRQYLKPEPGQSNCIGPMLISIGLIPRDGSEADNLRHVEYFLLFHSHRIGPFEVESALQEHPAVAESAVVSSPDEMRGEVSITHWWRHDVEAFFALLTSYEGKIGRVPLTNGQ